MNWKFFIGKTISDIDQLVIRSGLKFVHQHYPYNRNWMLDAKRILNKEPKLIIDAGANIGSVSKELNFWFPKAQIFAFEPVKNTFNILVNNTLKYPKIYPKQDALGATNEKVKISLSTENTINSLKLPTAHHAIGIEEISVIRLDEFLLANNLNHIDILKIDVEGFEFEVLEGCGTINIDCILLEVGYEREPTKVHFSDVEIYMERMGFQLCGVYELMRNLNNKKKLSYSNNLYIKKDLL